MKAILTLLVGVIVFVLAGGNVAEPQVVSPTPVHVYERVADSQAIAGTWYSFPVGTSVRFDGHGHAALGVDEMGKTIGYEADAWFEGQLLVVKFTDYAGDTAGESAACATVVGVYEVHLLEGGSIRFMKLQDDCDFRSDALSGQPDLGFDLVFHRVG